MVPTEMVAVVVLIMFFLANSAVFTKHHLEMQRLELINGSDIINVINLRVKKYNRTVAVIDGTFSVVKDLGDPYEFRLTVAHSPLGNNQFNEYPMKIPQGKACQTINESYREYQQYWEDETNLPMVGDEGLCPFPKGEYTVRNLAPSSSWIPPMVPDGYWRMTFDLINGDGVIECQIRLYMRITRSVL